MPILERIFARDPLFHASLQKFDRSELSFLSATFKELARRSKIAPKGAETMDKETFLTFFPLPGILAHQLFRVFDVKGRGTLDFEDFVVGMAKVLRGEPEDQTKLLFDTFSLARDDEISRSELRTIIKTCIAPACKMAEAAGFIEAKSFTPEKVDDMVERLLDDAFGDLMTEKRLSLDEFTEWISKHPDIIDSFFQSPAFMTHSQKLCRHKRGTPSPTKDCPTKGYLRSKSRSQVKLSDYVSRFYVLDNDYLYKYETENSSRPVGTYYLPGALIDNVEEDASPIKRSASAWLLPRRCKTKIDYTDKGDNLSSSYTSKGSASPSMHKLNRAAQSCNPHTLPSLKSNENSESPSFAKVYSSSPSSISILLSSSIQMSTLDLKPPPRVYGFSVSWQEGKNDRVFYAESEQQRDFWVSELRKAAKMRFFEDHFDMEPTPSLGTGAFASVYRAREKATGKLYAVKVAGKETLHPIEKEGLLSEIAVLQLARHPNIVELLSVFDTKTKVHLVMDICHGGDLFQLCEKEGILPEKEVKKIMRDVCSGLAYIHDFGIIHRDLKPSNILFSTKDVETRRAQICDFGYSKFAAPTSGLTERVGTLKYWAPEMLSGTLSHNTPVDMWALGLIVYRALTGVHPFDTNDPAILVKEMMHGGYARYTPEFIVLSREAKSFIERLLQGVPSKRMTAKEALEHPFLSSE